MPERIMSINQYLKQMIYYNRIDYLKANVKQLLEAGLSEAYIVAKLYTGEYSTTEINKAIQDVKDMYEL